jgi:BA14K-like protein
MRLKIIAAFGAAALGSATLSAQAAPAPASPGSAGQAVAQVQSGAVATDYAQYRGRGRYYAGRGYGPRGGYYGRRAYYGRPGYYGRPYGYYRRDYGGAAAAGVAGLAAGALIGGAIASQQAPAAPAYGAADPNTVAYCSQRYRSYDPASGTFLGYDGLRHPCP